MSVPLKILFIEDSQYQLSLQVQEQAELLNLAPVFARSLDNRITLWSAGAESLYGWSRDQALGRISYELLHTQFSSLPLQAIETKLQEQGWWEGELVHTRKDGRQVAVHSRWVLHRDPEGRPKAVLEACSDLSEIKRAEGALHQAVDRYERQVRLFEGVASTTPDFVYIFDLHGRFLYANRRLLEVWGMQLADVIGKTCRELGYEQWHHDMHMREIAQVLQTKRPIKGEVPFKAPRTGLFGIYEYIFSPVLGPDGEVELIAGTTRDVTERKRAEEILARSKEDLERLVAERTAKLQEAMAELEQMSYSMVHDMRAPLRAMQSFAMLLEEDCADALPAHGADYCRRIRQAANRLDQLITDALSYNKIVRQELPAAPVDLARLLRGIIESYPNLQPAAADIQLQFDQLFVRGNESLLTQCFGNLLGNAVKFVAPGVRPRVRVWAENAVAPFIAPELAPRPIGSHPAEAEPYSTAGSLPNPAVRIWVQDNGIGIPKDAQEKIFGMFQRMHRDEEYPGTGIGLAIVRKAVERMGGLVGVLSEPGKGSRFWVNLPLGRALFPEPAVCPPESGALV